MKTLLLLLTVFTLGFSESKLSDGDVTNDLIVETLIFDGYENGYFFFTNENEKALVLIEIGNYAGDHVMLKENTSTGEKYKVKYKVEKIKEEPSSNGTILQIMTP